MLLERGSLLNNRYRIIDILGQGGMGSVYKAIDENLGVEVAVKDNLFTTDDYARQFRREAVLLATLRHPNLPRVTDHFVIENQGQYLVMDYIEGEDLRQRMDRIGNLAEDEIIIIGAAICDALIYLCSRVPPIVHRDIKPGNVRITPDGRIYLVDFGLAKDMRSHQTTTTGARAMTPGYSPPEQYGSARTDHRTDIYSLGATLYAALTGFIPEDALSRAVDHVDLTPIRKHNPAASRKLSSSIEKALSIRPDERYQAAEEFKQAMLAASSPSRRNLEEYLVAPPPSLEDRPLPGDHILVPQDVAARLPRISGQSPPPISPASPGRATGSGRPKRPIRYYLKWVFGVLVGLVALIAVSAAWYSYQGKGFDFSALERIFGAAAIMVDETVDRTLEAAPATEDVGSILPASLPATLTPSLTPRPSLLPTSTLAPSATLTPAPTETAVPSPTSSPTSTAPPEPTRLGGSSGLIAFASDRDTRLPQIWLMDTDGGSLRRLTEIPEGACQPTWSPDGKQLIFISPCDRDKVDYPGSALFWIPDVNVETVEIIPLPTIPGGDYDPAWSPDGKKVAFTTLRNTGRPRIMILDLAEKSLTEFSEFLKRSAQPAWSPDGKQIAFVRDEGLGKIYISPASGGTAVLFSKLTNTFDLYPAWSPDGNIILYTQYPQGIKKPYMVADTVANPEDRPVIIDIGSVPGREARFSPDGLWVVFESWPIGGNHEIFIMTVNGSSRRAITNDPRNDFDPAWQPAKP